MLPTERHSCRSGRTAHGTAVSYSAWHTPIACVGVVVLFHWVFGRLQHALALTPFQARSTQGPFPPARCRARLLRYYDPLGLPPGSVRFPPSGLIPPVFVRLHCQVGSLLFRVLLWKRSTALYP